MKTVMQRLTALRRDESGQSLVFGVMTVFMVMFFAAMVVGVGRVTARRIQMQFAADSAAYSSALVESDCLNSIAMLNTSMAQLRYMAMRYVADVNVYGVLAELRDQVLGQEVTEYDGFQQVIADLQQQLAQTQDPVEQAEIQSRMDYVIRRRDALFPGGRPSQPEPVLPGVADRDEVQQIVGIDRADERYAEAYELASEWVPAIDEWLREMSRLEYTTAILAPGLAADAAYRSARENGAEYASVFPCSRWLPRENAYLSLDIYRLGEQWWRVEGGRRAIEVRRESPPGGGYPHRWTISWEEGASLREAYRITQLEEHLWYIENLITGDEIWIQQEEDTFVVTYGPEAVSVTYHREYSPPWMELVNLNGTWPQNTVFVRTVEGRVEYAYYQWDDDSGSWVMPQEDDFRPLSIESVEVDGVRVNVNLDPTIRIGTATITIAVPAELRLGWATITLSDPISVRMTIDGIDVWIRDERFGVGRRGHIIPIEEADGRWRTFYDRWEEYWWQHRLHELEQNYHWFYEYVEFGARLQVERNMGRLLAHGDVEGGPDSLPPWAYDSADNPQGWLESRRGALVGSDQQTLDELDGLLIDGWGLQLQPQGEPRYRYYQVRPCWDPFDTGVPIGETPPAGEPDGRWEFLVDVDGDGDLEIQTTECPTCGGKGYVLVGPEDVFGRLGEAYRVQPHRSGPEREDFQQAEFDTSRLPLVLSEEFFKYGTTVGVWHRRETHFRTEDGSARLDRPVEFLLNDPQPGMKGLFASRETTPSEREVLRPPWGFFALTGARPRLNDFPGSPADDELQDGVSFADAYEREQWVEGDNDNLYLMRSGPTSSCWDARLVALSRQVLDEDVILGMGFEAESGTGWLISRIARGSPVGWTSQFDLAGVPDIGVLLTGSVRPRLPYPQFVRGPYLDDRGLLRDPFTEYMSARPQGQSPRGGQLDYGQLDDDTVMH